MQDGVGELPASCRCAVLQGGAASPGDRSTKKKPMPYQRLVAAAPRCWRCAAATLYRGDASGSDHLRRHHRPPWATGRARTAPAAWRLAGSPSDHGRGSAALDAGCSRSGRGRTRCLALRLRTPDAAGRRGVLDASSVAWPALRRRSPNDAAAACGLGRGRQRAAAWHRGPSGSGRMRRWTGPRFLRG